ncbi:hypothetical protein RI367_001569 [Sorochytrium milnesiophthora]
MSSSDTLLAATPISRDSYFQLSDGADHQERPQYLYWVRDQEHDDSDNDNGDGDQGYRDVDAHMWRRRRYCRGVLHLLAGSWRRILALCAAVGVLALGLWLIFRPRLWLCLDAQDTLDLRDVDSVNLQILGFTEGYVRFVVNRRQPPYMIRVQTQIYASSVAMMDRFGSTATYCKAGGDRDTTEKRGYCVTARSSPPRNFDGRRLRSRFQATVHLPPMVASPRHQKRDVVSGVLLNFTTENLDYIWDVQGADHLRGVVLRTTNSNIKGQLSTPSVDIDNTNGNVDLLLTMAAARSTADVQAAEDIRVRTSNGDVSLDVRILGAIDDSGQPSHHRRDIDDAPPLRINAHSGNGDVRTVYTVPAVSPDPHRFKDHFHVDFRLQSFTGSSYLQVATDDTRKANNDRLAPQTAVRYLEGSRQWTLSGNVTTPKASDGQLPLVFGSRLNATLTTLRGDVSLNLS